MRALRIVFQTLGCRLNQYETDSLASEFRSAGYEVLDGNDFDRADIRVVNTCTVTNRADRKSRNLVNRAGRGLVAGPAAGGEDAGSRRPLVVVTGCATANDAPWSDDEHTLVVPAENKAGLFGLVDAWVRGELDAVPREGGRAPEGSPARDGSQARVGVEGTGGVAAPDGSPAPEGSSAPEGSPARDGSQARAGAAAHSGSPAPSTAPVNGEAASTPPPGDSVHAPSPDDPVVPDSFAYRPALAGFHTRGSIKIQDGCDQFCSYCIIPFVRGNARSRDAADILENCRVLVAQGSKELVLTGINMAQYRHGDMDFTALVAAILTLDLPFRLRIASMEPYGLGRDFARLFADDRLCPSLHLCLQSGSPRILEAMKRSHGLDDYTALVEELRAVRPDIALSTDLIAGFPGETEAEHRESMEAARRLGFASIHAFTYSRRRGTAADRMGEQVPEAVKTRRHDELAALGQELSLAWRARLDDTRGRVIVEGTDIVQGRVYGWGRCAHGLEVRVDLGPAGTEDRAERASNPGRWWNQELDVLLRDGPGGLQGLPGFYGQSPIP